MTNAVADVEIRLDQLADVILSYEVRDCSERHESLVEAIERNGWSETLH